MAGERGEMGKLTNKGRKRKYDGKIMKGGKGL